MDNRPRLLPPADAEHYDDLSELERERHENDMRLKNTFEHIFEKYSRDFSAIGDEIDLETGEIVVNNGHLAQLQDERDTGEGFDDWGDDGDVDDQGYDDEGAYTRYEVEECEDDDEDELLSSPPRVVGRRVSQPGELFTSLSSLTWQTSTIGHSSSASASHHRSRPSTNRPARPVPAVPQTPQRMDLANDPAFFQALGQSIAQGIAQYMSSYSGNGRPADPVWDAPPLPRSSHSTRRREPQPQRRRPMIPESPRHPPSRSVWATGRPTGRPRTQPRPSEAVLDPSPSIRNNAPRRQQPDHNTHRRRRNSPSVEATPPVEDQEAYDDHTQFEEQDEISGDVAQYEEQDNAGEVQYEEEDDMDEIQYGQQENPGEAQFEGHGDVDEIQLEEQDDVDGDHTQYEKQLGVQDDAQGGSNGDEIHYEDESDLEPDDSQYKIDAQINPNLGDEGPMDLDYVLDPDVTEAMEQEGDDDEPIARRRPPPVRDRNSVKTPSTPAENAVDPMHSGSVDTAGTHASFKIESPGQPEVQIKPRRTFKQDPKWTKEEDELYVELKNVRKLSFSQVARYFPGRNPRALENHYYKVLALRKGQPRGEMSDYVRRALERGPLLANKVRMKPYTPKNLEKARPDRANLTDPNELLRHDEHFVEKSRSDGGAQPNPECTDTTAAYAPPVQTETPVQVVVPTPVAGSGSEDNIYATGDPKKPWACKKCGKTWQHKHSSRYHVADPKRCDPLPEGRVSRAGRRNKTAIPPKVAPPSNIPPGIDINNGRPASFNPNILVRDDMERTHLCVLCGKSWASHSNAREHTRRPELCLPGNWLDNYNPDAHRKRKAPDGPSGPTDSDVVQPPKPSKKKKSAAQQASPESQQTSILHTPSTTHAARAENHRASVGDANNPANDTNLRAEVAPEPSTNSRRGLPARFIVSDNPAASQQRKEQIPIDPQLLNMVDTSRVINPVQKHNVLPKQIPGINKSSPKTPQGAPATQGKGVPRETVSNLAMQNSVAFSSDKSMEQAYVQLPSTGTSNVKPAHPSTKKPGPQGKEPLPDSPTLRMAEMANTGVKPTSVRPTAEKSSLNSKSAKPAPQPSTSKAGRVPLGEVQKRATPSKPTLSKPTPQTQASRNGIAQTASSAPAKQRPQGRPGGTITPQAKGVNDVAYSSPTKQIAKSDPRPRKSFVDLLADDSGDELAF